MQYKNYAVGAGTVAEDLPLTQSGSKRYSISETVDKMYDEWGSIIESAPHAQQTVKIDLGRDIPEYSIVRMINKNYKPE